MFCWLNFCWDGELSVTLCMDGQKATKDHIKRSGVFSACLVTEQLLPLADRLARAKGEEKQRTIAALAMEPGTNTPVLTESPLCYELEVKKTIPLDGSDIFVCRIVNTLVAPALVCDKVGYDLSKASPVSVSQNKYYGLKALGDVSAAVLPQDLAGEEQRKA